MLKQNDKTVAKVLAYPTMKTTVNVLAYTVGVAGNTAVIPQVVRAWQGNAPGLAVMTWVLFSAVGFVWLVYAVVNRQKPLIVAQIVCISCDLAVVLGWMFNTRLR